MAPLASCALGEGARLVLAPGPQQGGDAARAQAVELVDGAQHRQLLPLVRDARGAQEAVEQLAIVDLQQIGVGGQARGGVAGHRHGDDLRIGLGTRRADRVGVALDELALAPGPGLLVAPHRTEGIAPERLGQAVPVLGREAGQRGGQVVAQRHPLLVVVLQREHPRVGAVGVGQELAQRIGIFERPGLQLLEAERLIDPRHGGEDAPLPPDRAGATILKSARRARAGAKSVSVVMAARLTGREGRGKAKGQPATNRLKRLAPLAQRFRLAAIPAHIPRKVLLLGSGAAFRISRISCHNWQVEPNRVHQHQAGVRPSNLHNNRGRHRTNEFLLPREMRGDLSCIP